MKNSGSDPGSESFGFAVRRAHRAFDRALQRRLALFGLTTGYWYYLRALWDEDSLTQRQLSERTGVAESTAAVTIAAMNRDGLVTRTRGTDDRRKWCITLTTHARGLRDQLLPLAQGVNQRAAEGVEPGEQERFICIINRMTANLNKDEAETGGA